jgi:hypothetical protein
MARRPNRETEILKYFAETLHLNEGRASGSLSGMKLVIPILLCETEPNGLKIVRGWKPHLLLQERDRFPQIHADCVKFMKDELAVYSKRAAKAAAEAKAKGLRRRKNVDRPPIFDDATVLKYFTETLHRQEGTANDNLGGMWLLIPILICEMGQQKILKIVKDPKWKAYCSLVDKGDRFHQIVPDCVRFMEEKLSKYN